jgi:hypothetical protein
MELNERVPEEQLLYARWLDAGTRVGFAVLLAAFVAYVSGVLPPYVPLETLPKVWGMPVAQYLRSTGAPEGWSWLSLVARGDYLNLAGIVLLASVSAVCYARVLAALLARRERLQASIAAAQLLVFAAVIAGLC